MIPPRVTRATEAHMLVGRRREPQHLTWFGCSITSESCRAELCCPAALTVAQQAVQLQARQLGAVGGNLQAAQLLLTAAKEAHAAAAKNRSNFFTSPLPLYFYMRQRGSGKVIQDQTAVLLTWQSGQTCF